jgi:hypothetical protein
VLIAESLLIYLGPRGWFNRVLMMVGIGQITNSATLNSGNGHQC